MGHGLDIAYRMVAPILLGLMLGLFIDKQLGTNPWWMLGMTFFGIATGFWSILKEVYFRDGQPPDPVRSKPVHARSNKPGDLTQTQTPPDTEP